MIDIAYKDHETNPASVSEADLDYIDAQVYKIRPFGTYEVPGRSETGALLAAPRDERSLGINMRELNPQGASQQPYRLMPCLPLCSSGIPADIDKLVTVKGLVIRCTPIIPDMKTGQCSPAKYRGYAQLNILVFSLLPMPRLLPHHGSRGRAWTDR